MSKRAILIASLMLALSAPASAADKGMGKPPAPKAVDEKGVNAWVERYIDDEGYGVSAFDPDSVALVELDSIKTMKDGTLRFWSKTEYFKPTKLGEVDGIRSYKLLTALDCDKERIQSLAIDYYGENSLQGEQLSSIEGDESWTYLRPGSWDEYVAADVCAYVIELAKTKAAGSAKLKGVESEAKAWVGSVK
ncbi:MAG: hypothetical protein Q8M88_00880 [Phenylobacterium sp.]|uniref:surface-adhesin E family protein n=1 Tax=Phenylobacterium sp. TaxID=1871053 RepID=UPI002733659B|nr:surface-adhesin E family protein [Phenylobacterium sp.]MDP3172971.1 hypothetical protein [Phenylobacterium sp.]